MGNTIANLSEKLSGASPGPKRVLFTGMYDAGKTTILYKLGNKSPTTTIPTIGFNVEETTLIGLETTTWDLGGRTPMRPLWRHYFQNMRGIIFVLDASSDMLSWTKDELDRLLTEEGLAGLPLLLAINKMDLPNAKSATEIMETLNLNTLMTGSNPRSYKVVTLSATKDISGMVEGLEWLKKEMRTRVELSISPQTGNKTLSPNINKPMKAVSSSPKSVSDLKQQLSTDTMGQFPSTKKTATASASSSAVRAS